MSHAVTRTGLGSCPVVSLIGAVRVFLCADPPWGHVWGRSLIHGNSEWYKGNKGQQQPGLCTSVNAFASLRSVFTT